MLRNLQERQRRSRSPMSRDQKFLRRAELLPSRPDRSPLRPPASLASPRSSTARGRAARRSCDATPGDARGLARSATAREAREATISATSPRIARGGLEASLSSPPRLRSRRAAVEAPSAIPTDRGGAASSRLVRDTNGIVEEHGRPRRHSTDDGLSVCLGTADEQQGRRRRKGSAPCLEEPKSSGSRRRVPAGSEVTGVHAATSSTLGPEAATAATAHEEAHPGDAEAVASQNNTSGRIQTSRETLAHGQRKDADLVPNVLRTKTHGLLTRERVGEESTQRLKPRELTAACSESSGDKVSQTSADPAQSQPAAAEVEAAEPAEPTAEPGANNEDRLRVLRERLLQAKARTSGTAAGDGVASIASSGAGAPAVSGTAAGPTSLSVFEQLPVAKAVATPADTRVVLRGKLESELRAMALQALAPALSGPSATGGTTSDGPHPTATDSKEEHDLRGEKL